MTEAQKETLIYLLGTIFVVILIFIMAEFIMITISWILIKLIILEALTGYSFFWIMKQEPTKEK